MVTWQRLDSMLQQLFDPKEGMILVKILSKIEEEVETVFMFVFQCRTFVGQHNNTYLRVVRTREDRMLKR